MATINDIYRAYLGRDVDAGGLAYWQSLGLSPEELERQIRASGVNEERAYREQMVREAYRDLGMETDTDGFGYWMGQNQLSPAELRQTIMHTNQQQRQQASQAAVDAASDVAGDSQYAAYLRQMQFNESQIQSNLAAQREAIQRQTAIRSGEYDWQKYQAAQQIDQDFMNRGLYRAGRRQRDTNEAHAMVDQQQLRFETEQSERQSSLERDAATRIAEGRRQRAEEERMARERLTQRSVGRT